MTVGCLTDLTDVLLEEALDMAEKHHKMGLSGKQ